VLFFNFNLQYLIIYNYFCIDEPPDIAKQINKNPYMKLVSLLIISVCIHLHTLAQYCTPSFPSGTEAICRVQFNTIDNSTSCTAGGSAYEDFTAISTTVSPGNTYPITVYGNTFGSYTNHINVYIDWNNNGILNDAGESFYIGTIVNCGNCAVTGNITIPAGASGPKRMRVIKKYSTQADPCNTAGFGQAEDYTIMVTTPFTFHNTAAVAGVQTSFNHIKLQSTTPTFSVSSTNFATYNRIQLELNTISTFTGTPYIQTFTGTYTSGTKYDLDCNALVPNLPASEGTYFVRGRTSNDGGATWSNWSDGLWAYTNGPTYWGWHYTSNPQFNAATKVNTAYGNHLSFNNNGTVSTAHDDYIELSIGTSLNLITTAGDQALTEGTSFYSGAANNCITVGYYNVTGHQDYHGFRFQSAAIPQAANILAATFQPYAHTGSGCGGSSNTTNELIMVIKGVDQDNCAAWANNTNTATGAPRYRVRTVGGNTWNVPSGASQQWSTGLLITTAPDISNIIQEIVNKPTYAAGNAIGLIVDHNAGTGNYWRYFATMSASASYSARLATSFTNFENSIRFPNVALAHYVNAANWDQLIFTDVIGCAGCLTEYEVRNAQTNALIAGGSTSPINLNSSTADSVYVIAKIYRTSGSPQILDLTLTAVQSILAPEADFAANEASICAGECIDFTDMSTNTPTSWSWTFTGSSTPASSSQNPTGICYNTPGTYNVTLEASNAGGSDIETKTSYITVYSNPTVNIGPDTTICSGDNITLDAGPGFTNYTWLPAGSTQTINVTTGGTYSVTVTDGNTCQGSDAITISITTQADATITSGTEYCSNDAAVNLTATDPGGSWWGPGITNPSAGTFNPGTAGVGVHIVYYGIVGSCGDTASASITVYAAPNVNLGPDTTICSGDNITLNAGPGFTNYAWLPAGSTQTINVTTGGTYSVTVTDGNTCQGSDAITINVTTQADATITSGTEYCSNDAAVNLTATDPGGSWWGPGITNPSAGTFNPGTAGAGVHIVYYGIVGSCGDTASASITVYAAPNVNLGPDTTICSGDNLTLDAGPGFTNYAWLPSGSTQTINVTAAGTYSVTVTDNNSCSGSSSVSVGLTNQYDATIDPAGPFCSNDLPVNLTAEDNGGIWNGAGITNPGAGTFNPSTAGPGSHSISYTISGNCGDSDTLTIVVFDIPSYIEIHDDESCIGANDGSTTITISGGEPPYSIVWTGSYNGTTLTDLEPGTYTFIISDDNGCSQTGEVIILTSTEDCNPPHVFVPNIFSPNGDGTNDVLYVRGDGISEIQFLIFSRWGEKIFESTSQSTGWDGTHKGRILDPGVYVYSLDITLNNGERIQLKGDVTLVR
jgi:gliding motility-associated-like protein